MHLEVINTNYVQNFYDFISYPYLCYTYLNFCHVLKYFSFLCIDICFKNIKSLSILCMFKRNTKLERPSLSRDLINVYFIICSILLSKHIEAAAHQSEQSVLCCSDKQSRSLVHIIIKIYFSNMVYAHGRLTLVPIYVFLSSENWLKELPLDRMLLCKAKEEIK